LKHERVIYSNGKNFRLEAHPLKNIITIVLFALLADADDWADILEHGEQTIACNRWQDIAR